MGWYPEYKNGWGNHKEIYYTILKVSADELILQTLWKVVGI